MAEGKFHKATTLVTLSDGAWRHVIVLHIQQLLLQREHCPPLGIWKEVNTVRLATHMVSNKC